jgi:hypothetical protein
MLAKQTSGMGLVPGRTYRPGVNVGQVERVARELDAASRLPLDEVRVVAACARSLASTDR